MYYRPLYQFLAMKETEAKEGLGFDKKNVFMRCGISLGSTSQRIFPIGSRLIARMTLSFPL